MSIERTLYFLKKIGFRHDDDLADRMHYVITSNALIIAASICTYKTFDNSALECMTPSSFPKSWITVICFADTFN
uniref:Innexin n=1 Tax=Ascaris lumbricoides TaxID=6252 RepID=A0A0M3IA62_ASCLU